MTGHVAPAATVVDLRPQDSALGITLESGSRLCRCLRCDSWINVDPPAADRPSTQELPPADELPEPVRGGALHGIVVTRLIAIERALHVVGFLSVAVLLLVIQFGLPGVRDEAQLLLRNAGTFVDQTRPGHSLLLKGLEELSDMSLGHILPLLALVLAYALLEGVEAVFLWKGKRWAEYLTVVATVGLLPIEAAALVDKVTIPRILAMTANLLILFYLLLSKRLFGLRGGQKRLEAQWAAEVDWDQIRAVPPVDTAPLMKAPTSPDCAAPAISGESTAS